MSRAGERGAHGWSLGSSAGVGEETRTGVSLGRSSCPSCLHRHAPVVVLGFAGCSQWPEVVGVTPGI